VVLCGLLSATAVAQESGPSAERASSETTTTHAPSTGSQGSGVAPSTDARPSTNAEPNATARVEPSVETSAGTPTVEPRPSRASEQATRREPMVWESEVASRTLDNGLLARVQQRRDTTFASVCVTYGVGQSDDPDGYEGLAHLTEHLMFAATREIPDGFGRYVEAVGARHVNALTSLDDTEYCTEVPSEALDAVLFAEAMRMGFLLASLDEDDVERERAAVLHEQRERGRSGLGSEVQRSLDRALWGEGHPYSRERENEASVERIRLAHVRWFFQRWYGPKNATIAVVSPEEPAQVQSRVAHYFGALRGATPPERPHPELPSPDSARFVVLAPLIRDVLIFAWSSPRYLEADDAALDLVADALQERLGELFEDDDDVLAVSARVTSLSRGSTFEVAVYGDDEIDLTPYVARVHEVLDALRVEGPSDAELADARGRWSRSRGRSRWSPLSVAKRLASSRVLGQPELSVRDDRYAATDDESARAAARRWLAPEREVLVHRRTHGLGSREGTVRRRSLR